MHSLKVTGIVMSEAIMSMSGCLLYNGEIPHDLNLFLCRIESPLKSSKQPERQLRLQTFSPVTEMVALLEPGMTQVGSS